MKIFVVLALIPVALSGYEDSSNMDLLETLLATQIKAGSCQSKCSGLVDDEEKGICTDLCLAGDRSVCSFNWLCGEGCKAACRANVHNTVNIQPAVQESCTISWTVVESTPAVFILTGEDHSGMWKMLNSNYEDTRLVLTEAELIQYRRLLVLAVTEAGVTGRVSVSLQPALCTSSSSSSSTTNTPSLAALSKMAEKLDLNLIRWIVSLFVLTCSLSVLILITMSICRRMRVDNAVAEEPEERTSHNIDVSVDLVCRNAAVDEENIYEELDETRPFRHNL